MWEFFTREQLQEICSASRSLSDFGKRMGYKNVGKGILAAKMAIEKYRLDTSSIVTYENVANGVNPNKGIINLEKFASGTTRHRNETYRMNLISMRGHVCERCHLSVWNDQPIPLQVHHINGDRRDNTYENLQLLCPNCHAQTDNYCGKGKVSSKKVSDEEVISALKRSKSIRSAAMSLGLADTVGGFYNRAYKLIDKHGIVVGCEMNRE